MLFTLPRRRDVAPAAATEPGVWMQWWARWAGRTLT